VDDEFRPVVPFKKKPDGTYETYFGFVSSMNVDEDGDEEAPDGRVNLSDTVSLVNYGSKRETREALLTAASEIYTKQMYRLSDRVIEDNTDMRTGQLQIHRDHPEHGRLTSSIHEDDVLSAIDAAVNPNSGFARRKTLSFAWTDSTGELVFDESDLEAQTSPLELSNMLGVDIDQLGVVIVAATHGTADAYQDTKGVRYGRGEAWRAPGVYKIINHGSEVLGGGAKGWDVRNEAQIPIKILTIDPDIPPEWAATRTKTDEEADRDLGFE
jgi:hypothetical protein